MRRLTYANVTATLALVLAMSGGAYAARHYLINSTKQINPKVLRKLRGRAGQNGPVGPQGVTGHNGPRGEKGDKGDPGFSALSQLPSGKTESGDLTVSELVSEAAHTVSTAVSFPIQLAERVPAEKVEFTAATTPGKHCLAPGTAPPGFLCVYVSSELNVKPESGSSFDPEVEPNEVGSGKVGVGFNWMSAEAGVVRITGTWSVTAP